MVYSIYNTVVSMNGGTYMKKFYRFAICILILSSCFLLVGCPNAMDPKYVTSGDWFRSTLVSELMSRYWVNFKTEHLPVTISYQGTDGTVKKASFELDGYDPEKKIGYKLVLQSDKEEWEKSREEDNKEVPDLKDSELIQDAAVKHDFPIIFLWAYDYQYQLNQDAIFDNADKLRGSLIKLLNTPDFQHWAENGMYSGDWIRGYFEKCASDSFEINFKHFDLPVVTIEYGNNRKAVFQLDGYDTKKPYGYIFVTAHDEKNWALRRSQGDFMAPDLNDADLIRQAAYVNDYPILFIYVPQYWKSTVRDIVDKELYQMMYYGI